METYNPREPCKKCGRCGFHVVRWQPAKYSDAAMVTRDYLRVTCGCGFGWDRETLDAHACDYLNVYSR